MQTTVAAWSGESLRPWRRYYDGRHRYSTRRYDGAVTAHGAHSYTSGIAAAGDVITYLEAA